MAEYAILTLLGCVVGFFAGLLGIGGGAIMVPALTAYFMAQGLPADQVVHLALATAMSCIVFTALLSIRTHQKHQGILWPITYQISPMILLGSALATYWVVQISAASIALIFMLMMCLVAAQMVINFKPKSTTQRHISLVELIPAGLLIGFISALIAIGGGSLTVPYLTWHQINIKKAIGTAASIGLPLAVAGSLVFIWQGFNRQNLPEYTLGYVYWPATLAISLGCLLTTAVGAKLTHRLPTQPLKYIFAGLVLLLAVRMYHSVAW